MLSNTRVSELKEQHIDKATQLIVGAMLTAQPNTINQPQLISHVRNCIISCLPSGWSFVLLNDSQVVGVTVQREMTDWLDSPQLVRNFSNTQRGDIVYSMYTAVDSSVKFSTAVCFMWDIMARGKAAGWKSGYMRVMDSLCFESIKRLGGEEVESIPKEQFKVLKMDYSHKLISRSNLGPTLINSKL